MSTTPTVEETTQRSLLVRAVWFLLIGWWLTGAWLTVAWLLNLTIVGIPLGIKLINEVPMVVSLRRRQRLEIGVGATSERRRPDQHHLALRAAWFLAVGWWASGIWMGVAYGFTITIVGLPVAVWMYNQLPYVVSLYRY